MNEATLSEFLNQVKPEQKFWALCEPASEDWVILDSVHFENTDVMPLWSSQALAQAHCIDEWASYQPSAITVSQWLEFWVEDLSADNIIIGINWADDNDCEELGLDEFSQKVAEIETL
ncbi:DUF2750 domain-containing protein [Thalassotalea sp. LPB0316]|uniref:DUF2750 domain-containing protein n=1 Tax=Thalassotalea sp. LPB0316 TaxID=2769490 RepID=UPI001868D054|nr:DUF2750 domain-containing protein [Thalassotalea sp. LPB0316]QOL24667.1 DUF2750 domain-containing protein [Thalassotalea sp. LPB0316]